MRFIVILLVACSGDPTAGQNNPDASTHSDGSTSFTCRTKVTSVGSGHHNPGQDCNGSCHDHGFTLAGTLFAAPNSTTPQPGATITVIDANNKMIDIVTQANGNFYTGQSLAFPVALIASECPNVQQMNMRITAQQSGCNRTGCHQGGAQGVIHLP